jgi:hypothetical protein
MGALHEYLRYALKKVEKPSLNAFDPGDGSIFADPRQGFALSQKGCCRALTPTAPLLSSIQPILVPG